VEAGSPAEAERPRRAQGVQLRASRRTAPLDLLREAEKQNPGAPAPRQGEVMTRHKQHEKAATPEADRRRHDALWSWCAEPRCRRARACVGEAGEHLSDGLPCRSAMDGEDRAWFDAACAAIGAGGSKEDALRSGEAAREQYRLRQEIDQEMNQLMRDAASLLRTHIDKTIRMRRRRS
jgi:hypothetical protein